MLWQHSISQWEFFAITAEWKVSSKEEEHRQSNELFKPDLSSQLLIWRLKLQQLTAEVPHPGKMCTMAQSGLSPPGTSQGPETSRLEDGYKTGKRYPEHNPTGIHSGLPVSSLGCRRSSQALSPQNCLVLASQTGRGGNTTHKNLTHTEVCSYLLVECYSAGKQREGLPDGKKGKTGRCLIRKLERTCTLLNMTGSESFAAIQVKDAVPQQLKPLKVNTSPTWLCLAVPPLSALTLTLITLQTRAVQA